MKQHERLSLFGFLAVATVSLGGLLFGYHIAIVSGALCCIGKAFALSLVQQGLVVSLLLAGACLGTFLGGFFVDRLGRKLTIIGTAILFTIGAAMAAYAPSLNVLFMGRLVAGLAVGLISVACPLYLAEIAPPKLRGRFVSLNQLLITVGILVAYFVSYHFAHTENWRAMFAAGMLPSCLLAVAMLFFPETPAWLVAHQKKAGATRALKKLRQDHLWEEELVEMKDVAPHKKVSWKEFLLPTVKFALIIGIGVNVLQQITGINGVIYFAPKIFATAGFDLESTALLATISLGIINVVGVLISLPLVDRLGRKPLLQISFVGMALSLLLFVSAFYFQLSQLGTLAMISLMAYVAFFAIGLGPIPWVVTSEVFPLAVRGKGMSLAVASNWICNFLVAQSFLPLVQLMGNEGIFLLFALISLLAIFFVYRYVPETKGKSLEEIEIDLKRMKG